jgi:signal transduction histidine kinase
MVGGADTDRSRRIKRHLSSQRVHVSQLQAWQEAQLVALKEREAEVDERTRQALEMFHDVQTAASSIIRSGERLQATQPGRTDDERFEALPPAAKTLVKAAGLLELRLRTMPIVTNPAAAAYGNKIPKQIYRIVDLLVRTLQPLASAKDITLTLRGTSHRFVSVYESFDLLPLTLIENAIKYSPRGRRVDVTVNDTDSGIALVVCSFSPWIAPEERGRLFERRYRARITKETHPSGSGLGLYIAEAVATAHSTHVLLGSDDEDDRVDGVRHCTNRFGVNLR